MVQSVADLSRVDDRPVTSTPAEDPETQPTQPTRSARFRLGLLVALVVIIVGGFATMAWLLSTREVDAVGVEGQQAQLQSQREEVMAQTRQFMLRMGTYGPDLLDDKGGMPEYRSRVKDVITPKFAVSFEKEAATAEQLVAEAGISRKADVFATGVTTIDDDSATALVAGAFTDSYPKGGAREPSPFRIEVTLVKVKGKWLVDNFTPVTGAPQ
jgi:Mce-associated membrane protein